ncbi:MFS transporter, putative [Cordyceps militaris CM01]|uniref:MFS transporter, putative n=1 Tax=Cordyceps militaris (strain CM01) TaxID=983644 RepID=G3JDV1_CORMM|nr:MFS transporter, putative [Cordyceps militaris CM01]EGX92776.1 MFS transporter, putative [Cordyceps militaris CM01]
MPTYLCHGFRWHRRDMRIFVILNDLEEAAPDWVMGETTATSILDQFTKHFDFLPKISDEEAEAASYPWNGIRPTAVALHHDDNFAQPPSRVPVAHDPVLQYTWSPVKLLEEYDPDETVSPARPYAYVADHVVRVDLGADVLAEMAAYEKVTKGGQNDWFQKLRDNLQKDSDIGWHVVVCSDTEREYPDDETETRSDLDNLRLSQAEKQRPTTTMTTQSAQRGSFMTASSTRASQDQSQLWAGQDYSHMKPPPIPDDESSQGGSPGHSRRPSLRHRLSKAGLRRIFSKKDEQTQEQISPMAFRPQPGEASPSFAQTGAEFDLDDSDDDLFHLDEYDDDDDDDEAVDLQSEVGGAEAYQLRGMRGPGGPRPGSSRDEAASSSAVSARRRKARAAARTRRGSASTTASYKLYTPDEEAVVRRKFDRRLVLFLSLLFLLSFVDRSNIGNARIAGMEEDLQTTPPNNRWYEWSLTAFYVTYSAFEWMSLLYRVWPAHALISIAVVAWGVVASLQAVAPSYPVLVGLRALLGIAEAAFAGVPYYLSFFYRRHELAFRVALFIAAAPLASAFASSLAWLIVRAAGRWSPVAPWRLLFLVEGLPSVLAGVVAWGVIPDAPDAAPYLTPRERKIATLRLRREKPDASDAAEDAPRLSWRDVFSVALDPIAILASAIFCMVNIAYSSLPVFLPKIIHSMGYSSLSAQALSAPPYLFTFVIVLFTAHMSDRRGSRTLPIVFHALFSASGYLILGLAEPLRLPTWVRYLAVYPATMGFFNVVTLIITWGINSQPDETRRGATFAMMQFIGQLGTLVGTRLYPDSDGPYYSTGHRVCAAVLLGAAGCAFVLRSYLKRLNRKLAEMEDNSPYGCGLGALDQDHDEAERLVGSAGYKSPSNGFRYMI